MIDWRQIESLEQEIGPDDFAEVVEIFLEEVSDTISRLEAAPASATLGEDLHALKGSALNLGFSDFAMLCQSGETLAARGQADQIVLQPVLDCFQASRQAFIRGLTDRGSL